MLTGGPDGTKASVPTFPNARYLMGGVEFDHWRKQHERDDGGVR